MSVRLITKAESTQKLQYTSGNMLLPSEYSTMIDKLQIALVIPLARGDNEHTIKSPYQGINTNRRVNGNKTTFSSPIMMQYENESHEQKLRQMSV